MVQALEIWSELWQAYFGKNGYGGDTAEIYTYCVMPDSPGKNLNEERQSEYGLQAAKSLYSLLTKFSHDYDCKIEIMTTRDIGKEIGEWMFEEPLFHLCHVRVKAKTKK